MSSACARWARSCRGSNTPKVSERAPRPPAARRSPASRTARRSLTLARSAQQTSGSSDIASRLRDSTCVRPSPKEQVKAYRRGRAYAVAGSTTAADRKAATRSRRIARHHRRKPAVAVAPCRPGAVADPPPGSARVLAGGRREPAARAVLHGDLRLPGQAVFARGQITHVRVGAVLRAALHRDIAAVTELVDVVLHAPQAARLAHQGRAHFGADDL